MRKNIRQLPNRKLIKPSLRSVLKEALRVIDHFTDQVLYEHNVFEILNELTVTLNSNKILKKFFHDDFELLHSRISNFLSNKQSFNELKSELGKYKQLDLPYTLVTALFNKLENEDIPKRYADYLRKELNKPSLSFDKAGCEILFNLLSNRNDKGSIIITTNLIFDRWNEIFKDTMLTGAMVDRLAHKAHILDIPRDTSHRFEETISWLKTKE